MSISPNTASWEYWRLQIAAVMIVVSDSDSDSDSAADSVVNYSIPPLLAVLSVPSPHLRRAQ
jgi:hypothetical protein